MNITRPIYEIAADIRADWKKVNSDAKPYLDAMFSLDKITDKYYFDDGDSIVRYFLCNASTYRGGRAKELKSELKALLG